MQPLESRSANVPDAPVAPTTLPTISADIVAPVTTKRRAVAASVPAMSEKPVVAAPEADDDTPTIVIDPNDKSTMVEGQEASPKLEANKRKPITQAVVEADNASKQAKGAKAEGGKPKMSKAEEAKYIADAEADIKAITGVDVSDKGRKVAAKASYVPGQIVP